ncbi:MAG: hypothetical protein WBQ89_10300 [Candidatus Acidiferrum sp.]
MTLTAWQREGLHLLGYTRRESEFLLLVATHSGYFTIRQFKSFAQTESGSVPHAFVRKLLDRKHASYHAYRSGARVYHLFARKVYQAIDRENLRTRRKHELDYMQTRLVALDFVLQHPQHHYLETETEKITFFDKHWKLGKKTLPMKSYGAKRSSEMKYRYFVDRFPMFTDHPSAPTVTTFTYVDAGAVTLGGFGTHLRNYLGLFRAIPSLEFIYLSPTARLFQAAESEFYQLLYPTHDQPKSVSVLDYFRLRKAWETRQRVASADVVRLNTARAYYSDFHFEEMYGKWSQGTMTDDEVTRATSPTMPHERWCAGHRSRSLMIREVEARKPAGKRRLMAKKRRFPASDPSRYPAHEERTSIYSRIWKQRMKVSESVRNDAAGTKNHSEWHFLLVFHSEFCSAERISRRKRRQ